MGYWSDNRATGWGLTSTLRKSVALGAASLLWACSATFSNHGYVPTETELENVLVGTDTRGTVEEIIGKPSSTGVLSDGAWYYISSKVRYYTYNKPEIVERQILAISFDEQDVVTNIERFGLEDGRVITLSRRVTSSGVKGTSFLRQLISNFGNFNASDFVTSEDG